MHVHRLAINVRKLCLAGAHEETPLPIDSDLGDAIALHRPNETKMSHATESAAGYN
jgi:hypothetical protein